MQCLLIGLLVASQTAAPLTLAQALEAALERSPELASARSAIDRTRGGRLISEGTFDWTLESSLGRSSQHTPRAPGVSARDDVWTARVAATKRFGWGLEVTPSVQLRSIDGVVTGIDSSSVAARNVAVLGVRVTQPLLRGFGAAAVAERDAAIELQRAAMSDLQHFVAERVLVVALAYWRYRSATQAVLVLADAERRAKQLLEQTQQLVSADERPKADLGQVQANLADRVRSRLLAEQAVIDARAALGLEMGLAAEAGARLGPPATALPVVATIDVPSLATRLPAEAITSRYDVMSADARRASAELLLEGAEDSELPDLSLVFDVGYSGLAPGDDVGSFFRPIVDEVPGVDLGVTLSLRWPIASSLAAGGVMVARARAEDARLEREDLERRIRTNLDVALSSARSSAEAVLRSTEATGYHQTAVNNEEARMRSGLGTLIDVILSSDRLTSAVLAQLNDHERYASALARLSFESGALGQPTPEGADVVLETLTSPPR